RAAALETVLARLRAMLEGARDGPVALRLRGAPGVGKTRLLEEVKRVLQMDGQDVLYLAAGTTREVAVQLAHTLCARLGRAEAGEGGGEAREAGGIVADASELALEVAAATPLVLLLDDLERGGVTGPALFAALARALQFSRVTGEVPPRLALVGVAQAGALELPGLEGDIQDVEVEPLDRGELARFLAVQFTSEEPDGALMDDLWAVARGNPRWAGELAAWMLQAGVARVVGGRWEVDPRRRRETGLPETMEQAVQGALASLGDAEAAVLGVLAAAGSPLRMDRLCGAAGLSPWDAEAAVERLVGRGYVRFEDAGRTALPVVDSPSLQRLVRAARGEEDWRSHHAALLATLGEADAHARRAPAEVAHHAFHAGRTELARRWALPGVRDLMARCEFEAADRIAELALAAGCDAGEVSVLQARIATLTGHYQEGIRRVWGVLEAGPREPAVRARLLETLAELYFRKGEYGEALAMIDGSMSLADAQGARRLAALRARVHLFRGDHADALAAASEAAVDDGLEPLSRLRGLNILGLIRSYRGDFDLAEEALLTARRGFEREGDLPDQAFVLNSLGLLYQKKKDFDAAERYYRESRERARAAGSAERTNVAGMNLSVLLQERGRYAEAIEQYRETLRAAWRIEDRNLLMRINSNLGNIHRYLGHLEAAREWAERSLALATASRSRLMIGLDRLLLAEIDLLSGRIDPALEGTRGALALLEELGVQDESVEALIDLAACHLAAGEASEALRHARDAEERSRSGRLPNHLLRTLLLLARLALEHPDAGAAPDVEALLDEARGLLEAAGTPELAWRLHLLAARAATQRGAGGDADVALGLAETALRDLTASVPEAYRRAFFARRDRAELLRDLDRVRGMSAALGRTMAAGELSPGAGVSSAPSMEDLHLTRSLLEMNRRLAEVQDLEQALEVLVDTTISLADAERGFVLLRRDDRFSVVVARNLDGEAIRRSRAKVSRSIADRVLESGEPVVLEDAVADDYFSTRESVMALRVRSIACLPLRGHRGIVGALYLDNRFRPGLFQERMVKVLDIFAHQAALAIENALLLEHNRDMLAELARSKQEVERLNARLEEEIRAQGAVLDQTREELGRRQAALEERFHFTQIVGQSAPVRSLFEAMARVARTGVPVLVLGESGTGKELVARALHYNGPRGRAPFVAVNCAALPENLLESELFGHEKGAFTGAVARRKGMFSAADGGTLFLDEVGDMSPAMQTKLLRALQEGEFVPVGASEAVR
ncbi:MAG: sigma 54-interacting transcriptional regulator, partial [Deltaproteobacteria bacterium]|nr:sigma 54-interacting transcriptional regulator [Deltaproteobacteria bacterium]